MLDALYSVVGLVVFALAGYCAWLLTTCALPLDHRFPEPVERSLPLQGRWLRTAARAVIFPVVLLLLIPGVMLMTFAVIQAVLAIGSLFTL